MFYPGEEVIVIKNFDSAKIGDILVIKDGNKSLISSRCSRYDDDGNYLHDVHSTYTHWGRFTSCQQYPEWADRLDYFIPEECVTLVNQLTSIEEPLDEDLI